MYVLGSYLEHCIGQKYLRLLYVGVAFHLISYLFISQLVRAL